MSENVKATLSPATRALLAQDIPDAAVLSRHDGDRRIQYLKASTAITLANLVFGPGGWSTEVRVLEPIRGDKDNIIGYSAIVRVTIHENGALYEDVGISALERLRYDYLNQASPINEIDAHERARKGAVSDAVKRCLRNLGPLLGNSLYEDNADRNRTADAALEILETRTGSKANAEDQLFGAKYQYTSQIPLHLSLAILLPDHQPAPTKPDPAEPDPAEPTPRESDPAEPDTTPLQE